MPYKRELHCHIIPGVDDGSPEMSFSIEYLRALAEFGVERVIFTPHHTHPNYMNTPTKITPIFEELSARVAQEQVPISCEGYSFEYRLDESFLQMMETGKYGEETCSLRPLKDRYILVENSFTQPLINLDKVIYNLQEGGWFPILAHPERYFYYFRKGISSYNKLRDYGLEFQCNILSFTGYYGNDVKKIVYQLLDEGLISYLGSDLHNRQHVNLIRKFLQSKEYEDLRPELVASIGNDSL